MKTIPALTAFTPAGHYSFKPLPFQLCLTSFSFTMGQYYLQKRQKLCPQYMLSALKKSQCFKLLARKISHGPLFGVFAAHTQHPMFAQQMFRQYINLIAAQTQGFQHRISPAIMAGLSQEHRRCEQLQGTTSQGSELLRAVLAQQRLKHHEPQRSLAAMSSHWAPSSMKGINWWRLTWVAGNRLLWSGKAWGIMTFTSSVPCPQAQSTLTLLGGEACKGWERSWIGP